MLLARNLQDCRERLRVVLQHRTYLLSDVLVDEQDCDVGTFGHVLEGCLDGARLRFWRAGSAAWCEHRQDRAACQQLDILHACISSSRRTRVDDQEVLLALFRDMSRSSEQQAGDGVLRAERRHQSTQ